MHDIPMRQDYSMWESNLPQQNVWLGAGKCNKIQCC